MPLFHNVLEMPRRIRSSSSTTRIAPPTMGVPEIRHPYRACVQDGNKQEKQNDGSRIDLNLKAMATMSARLLRAKGAALFPSLWTTADRMWPGSQTRG
jgi:hypothetical protein